MYENPLAYLVGLEGLALLRSFTGEHGREFVEARLAELRKLLDDEALAAAAVDVARVSTVEGYAIWAQTYDGPNSAFALDEPVIGDMLDGIRAEVALDAACGTGRMAALLADRGHRVLGVDSSPDMLARARQRVPGGDFRLGELTRLPVADDAVDLVVCSLALTHVPDLRPVLEEFARVLRPGGHVLTSDVHPDRVALASVPPVRLPDGRPGRLESHRHSTGDYLRAALQAGFEVRRCEEPMPSVAEPAESQSARQAPMAELGPWELWPWCLADLVPEAAAAARADMPAEIIWQFRLPGS